MPSGRASSAWPASRREASHELILGDPETCVREFRRWHEATGASTLLLRLRHAHSGGPAHDKIMEAIRLFGERVLPYV
jgi:alkanesulfonate monooxygenase SsuD/methylene tetrahydromethanopterin reductase-like flavin-dependent oxidoreductase (luciferase family)